MVSMINLSTVASLVKTGCCMYGSIISMNGFTNKVRHGCSNSRSCLQHVIIGCHGVCCKKLLGITNVFSSRQVSFFLFFFLNNTVRVLRYPVFWHTFDFNSLVLMWTGFIYKINKMNCELMLTYDTPAVRQTGSRNLMGPKTLPTI